jgi:hypothetical protein
MFYLIANECAFMFLFQQSRTAIILLPTAYFTEKKAYPNLGQYVIRLTTAAPVSIRLPGE